MKRHRVNGRIESFDFAVEIEVVLRAADRSLKKDPHPTILLTQMSA
jgi:hypothetical protein